MKTVLHRAKDRGYADHGWLKSSHSFSFANYYNPERMGFGLLRVLNDDHVAPGRGFGTHPHENMEIVSIPLEGDLEHRDSMGNEGVIRSGDVQIMSAGSGIRHSEMNASQREPVKFLQIWVMPREKNIPPRYDQMTLRPEMVENRLFNIVRPSREGDGVWINQDAWFYLGYFTEQKREEVRLHGPRSGLYVFVIEGGLSVGEHELGRRDAIGIWDVKTVQLGMKSNTRVLVMEVPME